MNKEVTIYGKNSIVQSERWQFLHEVMVAVFFLSSFLCVLSCFMEPLWVKLVLVFTAFFPILILCFPISSRQSTWVRNICTILTVVSVLAGPTRWIHGFLSFANLLIEMWNHHFHTFISGYRVEAVSQAAMLQFYGSLVLLALLFSILCVRMHCSFVLIMAGCTLLLAASYFQLDIPLWIYVAMGVGVWLFFAAESMVDQGYRILLSVVGVTLAVGVLFVTVSSGFTGSTAIANVKDTFLQGIDYLRFGRDSLPQGDLTKAAFLKGDGEKTLCIRGEVSVPLHLRGFVGGTYTGSGFERTDLSAYSGDMNGLMEWLAENNFQQPYQMAHFCFLTNTSEAGRKLSVINRGAYRKYLYLPYETISLERGDGGVKNDWQVASKGIFGAGRYEFTMEDSNSSEDFVMGSIDSTKEGADQFEAAENEYRNFVYNTYLTVDDHVRDVVEEQLFSGLKLENERSVEDVTGKIRLALLQYNQFAEKPDVYSGEKDFIDWFLENDHKCNSAYYAAAAVLAYRCAGIPARYVEGYYLSEAQISNASSQNESEVSLTGEDTRAWVETYIGGVGWLPVEVTLGYYQAGFSMLEMAVAPEDTIEVVQGQDDSVAGKTTDSVMPGDGGGEGKEPPLPTVLHFLGWMLLTGVCILGLAFLVRMQAYVRSAAFYAAVQKSRADRHCRMVYDKVCRIFLLAGVTGDLRFPRKCVNEVTTVLPGITADEINRFISIVEKGIFKGSLYSAELVTIDRFMDLCLQQLIEKGGVLTKVKTYYVYALHRKREG